MGETLRWGHRYALVRPDHFRVAYEINPYMHLADQPDPARARDQWDRLVSTLRGLDVEVAVLGQRCDAPDMVYAMNLGFAATTTTGEGRVVMSHMRHPERRMEHASAAPWFADLGFEPVYVGRDGVGAHLEAGDAFCFSDALVVGFGPRTDELGVKALGYELGTRVRGVRIVHPAMYHLDLAFCPLDSTRAMVCPAAFDPAGARALLDLVPDPLVLSEAEALTMCANSVVVGRTVVMPACPPTVRAQLADWGFEVVVVEMGELHKGGGSIRCLTNPLDVVIGRDVPSLPGGDVLIAR
ncbi:MAG: amidinotransferase [Nocardioidaceae bacterium]|nr:amidinotransferase [Nocardioidaceae bacterium]